MSLALLLAALLVFLPSKASAQERIPEFSAAYVINADGSVDVTETIRYDFGTAERHGIFRNLVDRQRCSKPDDDVGPEGIPVYECPSGHDRLYNLEVLSVTNEGGQPYKYEVNRKGDGQQIKIGDPDRTISGLHTYVIRYRLDNVLNAYPNHDEFFWNATGSGWSVPQEEVHIAVQLPDGAELETECFQGRQGSTWKCRHNVEGSTATYASVNPIWPGEQVTIGAKWQQGLVEVAPPTTEDRQSIDDYFALDFMEFGGAALVGMLSLGGVVALWWRNGRDRAYRSIYYLTDNPEEGAKPLFSKDPLVVEYMPPDDLRPAQVGVLLDERADTIDVTATIIDLAVRGHLHIRQIERRMRKDDWELEKQESDDPLLPYEETLYKALFPRRKKVRVSQLKNKFYNDLKEVRNALYDDAVERGWFAQKPETSRTLWFLIGLVVTAAGVGAALLAGGLLGRALIGAPIALAGVLLMILAPSMKRRTAKGSEAMRRILGFRLYIATAEQRIQEFNEREQILNNFAKYLPYAMVFGLVDKWGKALEGIGAYEGKEPSLRWYAGVGAFSATSFSREMSGFSSSVSSTIASTPSSGGSGFSGGSAGGGGGGGGGGSW